MATYFASVDAGNGGTNAVLAKGRSRPKRYYEPSVRAVATGDSLGLGKDLELQYDYVDWYGHRYVTGDDVIRVTRRNLEHHLGTNRYGNEFHQFLVAVALAKLGVTEGTVDLTVFAPPGVYNDISPMMQQRFLEEGGWSIFALKGISRLAPGAMSTSRSGRRGSARRPATSSTIRGSSSKTTSWLARRSYLISASIPWTRSNSSMATSTPKPWSTPPGKMRASMSICASRSCGPSKPNPMSSAA